MRYAYTYTSFNGKTPAACAAIQCRTIVRLRRHCGVMDVMLHRAQRFGGYAATFRQISKGAEANQFYEFTRTLDAYKSVITPDSTMLMSTDSDLFKFLKDVDTKPVNSP